MEKLDPSVEKLGIRKGYRADSFLFHAKDEARGFFYVRRGGVRVFRMDENGREMEIVRLGPGDFFGEAVAIAGGRFPAFARATEDTEVLYFDREETLRSIGQDPAAARFFLKLLAGKCLVLNERIESLGLLSVRQRLARYLLSCCGGSQSCLVELKTKKSDLARQLGIVSETLSRNLRQMEDEGLIQVKGRQIRVTDCRRLREELPE
jgi:CRP/FNR family transcriptional regulator, dissimilatory nitrate respiration regulator